MISAEEFPRVRWEAVEEGQEKPEKTVQESLEVSL